jgi:hypothetical protein
VKFVRVLRITVDFFLIGDPSPITVNSVSKPTTIILGAVRMIEFGIADVRSTPRHRRSIFFVGEVCAHAETYQR